MEIETMDSLHLHSAYSVRPSIAFLVVPLILYTCYTFSRAIYNAYFGPLRHIPGPKLNAASRIPYCWHSLNRNLAQYSRKLHERYGDVVRISPTQVSFISGETAWRDIFGLRTGSKKGHAKMEKDPVWYAPPVNRVRGIFTADDENHSRQRRVLSHAFSEKALSAQMSIVQDYVDQLIDRLKERAMSSSEPVDLEKWYNWTTFDVIADLLLGQPFGCLQNLATHEHVETLIASLHAFPLSYIMHYFPALKYLFQLGQTKDGLNARIKFAQWVASLVKARSVQEKIRPDFMTYILKNNNENGQSVLSEGEIQSISLTLLAAGSETTATTLAAVTYLLCTKPDAMDKLKNVVRSQCKRYEDITLEKVNSMPYLIAVLSEALRCLPPAPVGFDRRVGKGGEQISGLFIPEGTGVSVPQFAAYRSSRNFKDPDKYIPERWLGDSEFESDVRESFHPFSFGPRNCIGKNLAYAEMRLIMAKMIWTFDIELDPGSKDWAKECKDAFVWIKPPLLCRLTPIRRE